MEELVGRFLDGTTTAEEEKQLYAFFRGNDIPEHLQPYREMFAWFGQGLEEEFATKKDPLPVLPVRAGHRFRIWGTIAAVAATVALILLVRPAAETAAFDPFEGSYIVRNGVKITDPALVRAEAEATIRTVEEEELKMALLLYNAYKEEFAYARGKWERGKGLIDFINSFPEGEARREVRNILLSQE